MFLNTQCIPTLTGVLLKSLGKKKTWITRVTFGRGTERNKNGSNLTESYKYIQRLKHLPASVDGAFLFLSLTFLHTGQYNLDLKTPWNKSTMKELFLLVCSFQLSSATTRSTLSPTSGI